MTEMNVSTRFVFATSLGVSLALGSLACSSASDDDAAAAADPVAVTVATIAEGELAGTFEAGGVIQARTSAALTSRVVAQVAEVRVRPGDRVRAGDVLIVLDGGDLVAGARRAQASVRAAEQGAAAAAAEARAADSGLTLARQTHARIAGLAAKRSATSQELDEAAAALAAAEARAAGASARALEASSVLESARAGSDAADATAAFTRITAPFDGVVTEKRVDPGHMAMPGQPLVVLEDTRGFRLDVRVDASRVGHVAPGAPVPVTVDAAIAEAMTVTGTVAEVARAFDAGAHTSLVKITLPDTPNLQPGLFGRARFTARPRRGLTVPASALVRRGQVTSVFTVEQDVARLRLVNVSGNEVLAGLTAGETVVVNPPAGLVDGRRVRPGAR
jgi:RND family efflux transporter MFP subunit